jgi:hypothetical protein
MENETLQACLTDKCSRRHPCSRSPLSAFWAATIRESFASFFPLQQSASFYKENASISIRRRLVFPQMWSLRMKKAAPENCLLLFVRILVNLRFDKSCGRNLESVTQRLDMFYC